MRRHGGLLRYYLAASNIDAISLQRAIGFLDRTHNCDVRAWLQLAFITYYISEDNSIGRYNDLLFPSLYLTVNTGPSIPATV